MKKPCLLTLCAIFAVARLASARASKDLKAPPLSAVQYVRERSAEDLKKFGQLVRAYTLMMGDKRILIEVDFIRNLSGVPQELPSDLSDYVINAIGQIGSQFGTYHKYGGVSEIPGALLAQPPQPDPPVDFRITGSLERASEVEKNDSKKGFDPEGGGGGSQWNGHIGRNRSRTVKSLTVTFTLEGRDRVSIPGASATYRIDVEQQQRERALSFYVAGSGLSLDSNVTVTQNLDDAIYDATAASIIHILGNALQVPYYRVSSVFQPDQELDQCVRENLARLSPQNLEHNLKVWMLVEGYPVAAGDLGGLTDHDRAIVELEMFHRRHGSPVFSDQNVFDDHASLVFDQNVFGDPKALADFAFSLWKNLDYLNGAQRVETYLTELAHQQELARRAEAAVAAKQQREQQERAKAEAAAAAQQQQREQEERAAAAAAAKKRSRSKRSQASAAVCGNATPCGAGQPTRQSDPAVKISPGLTSATSN